jgi:hypothetical protein
VAFDGIKFLHWNQREEDEDMEWNIKTTVPHPRTVLSSDMPWYRPYSILNTSSDIPATAGVCTRVEQAPRETAPLENRLKSSAALSVSR